MCPAYPADTERPQPPVPFRDVRPPDRLRPVAPAMHASVQVLEVALKILPVVVPRHAIHPRRGLRPKREVRRPQTVDIDVVQERREPCFLVLLCDLAHAIQRTWRALSGSASGARFAGRVPLGQPPFLSRLRGHLRGVVRRVRRYYGAV
jgi:hypothetical protein